MFGHVPSHTLPLRVHHSAEGENRQPFRSKPQETPKQRFAQRGSKSDALQYKIARLSPQQHISGERVGSNPSDFTSMSSSMRRVTMIPVSQALDGRRNRTEVLRPTFTMVLRDWNE